MAVYGLQFSFGLLEPQSVLLVLFRVFLLFALSLAGRRAFVALLLQLLAVLFHELLDFPSHPGQMQLQQKHWRYEEWCCEPEKIAE
jgi:hypothetical protein